MKPGNSASVMEDIGTQESEKRTEKKVEEGRTSSLIVYRRLLKYLQPYRRLFFLSLGAMIVFGATDGLVPYLLKRVLDDVFGNQDIGMLKLLSIVIVVFAILRGFFGFLQRYLIAKVGLGIIRDLRDEISDKLLHLSSSFYHAHSTGSLIARVTNDTLLVRTALTDAAATLLRDSVRVIALLIATFYLDYRLALIALVAFPLGLLPVVKYGRKVRRFSRVGQAQFGGLTGFLQEMIIGHKVVQAFTREDYEQERFKKENEKFTSTFLRAEKYGALSSPTNEMLASLAIAGVIFYGGQSVISGVRTQGDFIAFLTSMFLLYEPLKKLSKINTSIQTGVSAAERIFDILDTESEILDSPDAKPLSVNRPRVEFRDVSFCYSRHKQSPSSGNGELKDSDSPWAVRNVSLNIEPGETVALVGMSGGGKSTLVNLLPRYYDPQKGSVEIDGIDVRSVTLKSLRQTIAIVSQHTFLFNDSVFSNIAYGRDTASEADVLKAAKAANAHEFISALPEGYHTVIGEQGLMLSGGERARVAMARALLKDAPILILDEATASLDSESEILVQEAIEHLMEGRTVMVIAHRLATIREADKIAVIVDGKIVEVGPHQQLLDRGGEYAKLYKLQFRDSSEKAETVTAVG